MWRNQNFARRIHGAPTAGAPASGQSAQEATMAFSKSDFDLTDPAVPVRLMAGLF